MAGNRIIYGLGLPAQAVRVRAFTPVAGFPVVTAGRQPDPATILYHLNTGTRPSLVGSISGLTREMEDAFRADRIVIQCHQEHGRAVYAPERVGYGDTLSGASWSELGLVDSPSDGEKHQAYQAYLSWLDREVFPESGRPISRTSRGAILVNACSEEQARFVDQFLAILPGSVISRGAVKTIDLNGSDDEGKLGRYDLQKKTLTFNNNVDRYFFTRIILFQFGNAVFHTLGREDSRKLELLAEACVHRQAAFGADLRGDASEGRGSLQTLQDFFAENFMHFIIAGAGMAGHSQNWALRGQLFDFYAQLFPTS